jgi:hypothetical protein
MARLVLTNAAGVELHAADFAENRHAYAAAHTVRTMIRAKSQRLWMPGDKGTSGYFVSSQGVVAANVIPDATPVTP